MPRPEKAQRIQRIRRLLHAEERYKDCAGRLVVYRKDPETKLAVPFRSLLTVYGGIWDRVAKCYVKDEHGNRVLPPPERIKSIPCHEGQVRVLTLRKKKYRRIVARGATGAGKSKTTATRGVLNVLEMPNCPGGLTAPTNQQRRTIWDYFIGLCSELGILEGSPSESRKQVYTVNNCTVDVLATQRQSKEKGHPTQGRNWFWCVADESSSMDDSAHEDLWARGRVAGDDYQIFESTTNDDYPAFMMRLERYRLQPEKYLIVDYFGWDNPWVSDGYWEALKDELGGETSRAYQRKVLLRDVPPERLVYPRFSLARNVRPRPPDAVDITPRITHEIFGTAYRYVIGQDFGRLVHASIVLKAYELPGRKGEVFWWAIDEITSNEYADRHARLLKQNYDAEEVVVIADPHFNTHESDKSDYQMFRNEGLTIVRASGDTSITKKQISREHRLLMVNMLLEDGRLSTSRCTPGYCPKECLGHGEPRLFLAGDGYRPVCKQLARALMTQQRREDGDPDPSRKDKNDMTHWPAALGYGLWKFEKIRGNGQIRIVSPDNRRDFWEKEH